jgi:ATP-dependent RNA helicase MSS116
MLVATANEHARHIGLKAAPALQRKTIGMMGLKGVPGLVVEEGEHHQQGGRGGGGQGGFGSQQISRRPVNAGAPER